MGYLHDETDAPASQARVFAAMIASDAVDMQDPVDVTIPNFDGNVRWTDVVWQPRGNSSVLPQRGDSAVVVMDDNDELWIVGWTPSARDPRTISSAYTSGPPSDSVDGDVWVAKEISGVGGNGEYWQFQYDPSNLINPWKFTGGPAVEFSVGTPGMVGNGAWHAIGVGITIRRAGLYKMWGSASGTNGSAVGAIFLLGWGINGVVAGSQASTQFYNSGAASNVTIPPTYYTAAVNTVITMQYLMNGGVTGTGLYAAAEIVPIKIA